METARFLPWQPFRQPLCAGAPERWAGRELGAGGRVFEGREFGFCASLFFSNSDKAVISIVWVKHEQR